MTAPYVPPKQTVRTAGGGTSVLPEERTLVQRLTEFFNNRQTPQTVRSSYTGPIPAWMDSLMTSPQADTVFQAAVPNRRPNIGVMKDSTDGYGEFDRGGMYTTERNPGELRMNPSRRAYSEDQASTYTPLGALQHEAGHALSGRMFPFGTVGRQSSTFPRAMYDYPASTEEIMLRREINAVGPQIGASVSPEARAVAKLNLYGSTSPEEGFASSFRNAVNWLSSTAVTGDDPSARARLADLEAQTPGTGNIVNFLLKNRDIYRNHPLRKGFGW